MRSATRAARRPIYQQGTYAPDANFRWMGSIAMDGDGNIALGYSASRARRLTRRSRITGRLAGDPLDTMGAEDVVARRRRQPDRRARAAGATTARCPSTRSTTARSGTRRSTTRPRPAASTSRRAIGSFDSRAAPRDPPGDSRRHGDGRLEPDRRRDGHRDAFGIGRRRSVVHDDRRGGPLPVPDAAGGHVRCDRVEVPLRAVDGRRRRRVLRRRRLAGLHARAGRDQSGASERSRTAPARAGRCTRRSSSPVRPASRARPCCTDPVDAALLDRAGGGFTYDFAVTSLVPGYAPGGGPLTIPPAPASARGRQLDALRGSPTCTAPGYGAGSFSGPLVLSEGFGGGTIPAGWSVETPSGVSWKVYTAGDPCFQFDGNRTGGSGPYAIVNSGCETQFTNDDTRLVTPPMDLSGRTSAAIQWANDFIDQNSGSIASVDVSDDGGATLDERLAGDERHPRPGSPDRGHLLRRGPRERRVRASTIRASSPGGGRWTT